MSKTLLTPSQIPIVDLSIVEGKYEDLEESAFEKLAKEFGKAMNTVGFAYILNHGVDMEKIEHIHKLSKQFYDLPVSIKNKYKKENPAQCFHGYGGPGDELHDKEVNSIELREFYDTWGFEQFKEDNFPSEVQGYKDAFDAVRPECNNLGKKLLRALGKFLKPMGLDDEHLFVKAHSFMNDATIQTQAQFRTLNYYPLNDTNIPPNAIRFGEHTDWGTVTLLFQDLVGGLEVKRLNGTWIEAVPLKDSILINAGQLLELWSARIFQATPHRVRIVDCERTRKIARQSFIYFVNPDGDEIVKPVVSCPPGDKDYLLRPALHSYNHYKDLIAQTSDY